MTPWMLGSVGLELLLIIVLPIGLMVWAVRCKSRASISVGLGCVVASIALLWLDGIMQVERCVQTCSSLAPREACRVSCNLESSWPFIYLAEMLLLMDSIVFVVMGRFLRGQPEARPDYPGT